MLCISIHRNVAAVIGTLILLRFSLRLLSNLCAWIRAYFLAPWGIGRTNLKKYGPWASECMTMIILTLHSKIFEVRVKIRENAKIELENKALYGQFQLHL